MPGSDTYHVAARMLHWAMAVGLAFMWGCGYAMTRLVAEDGPWEDALKSLHISVGVTLLVLLVARVVVRILDPPPPLPQARGSQCMSAPRRTSATLRFWRFRRGDLPRVDEGEHQRGRGPVVRRGHAGAVPCVEGVRGEAMERWAELMHRWTAYAMLALAAGHVAAIFKHRWLDRVDVLYRMALWTRKEKRSA